MTLRIVLRDGETILTREHPLHIPNVGDNIYANDKLYIVFERGFHYNIEDEVLIWVDFIE